MKNMEFGLTLTVLGMGGTLAILLLISVAVDGMNRILRRGEKKEKGRG
jgi:Na+-transporting methylmalonyl-CoA/oxaloacetate decarboxylase gamma subunit